MLADGRTNMSRRPAPRGGAGAGGDVDVDALGSRLDAVLRIGLQACPGASPDPGPGADPASLALRSLRTLQGHLDCISVHPPVPNPRPKADPKLQRWRLNRAARKAELERDGARVEWDFNTDTFRVEWPDGGLTFYDNERRKRKSVLPDSRDPIYYLGERGHEYPIKLVEHRSDVDGRSIYKYVQCSQHQ